MSYLPHIFSTKSARPHLVFGASLLIAAAVFLLPESASATTIIVPDIEEMAVEADAIVVGEVRWSGSYQTSRGVEREVILRVTDVWKNEEISEGRELSIRTYGGRAGGITTRTFGTERYAIGEEAVVFLRRTEDNSAWQSYVLAWSKFRVMEDHNGSEDKAMAIRDISEITPLKRAADGRLTRYHAPQPEIPLDELRRRVRSILSPENSSASEGSNTGDNE